MENMENKMQTTELSPREEYHQEFLPQVHKIGATTMAVSYTHLMCIRDRSGPQGNRVPDGR